MPTATPAEPYHRRVPQTEPVARTRRWWHVPGPAFAGAVTLAALSLPPGLLPHAPAIQGVVTGLAAGFGFGVGLLLALIGRLILRRPAPRGRSGRIGAVLGAAGCAVLGVAAVLGKTWQDDVRGMIGVEVPDTVSWCLVVLMVATAVCTLLVALGRAIRRLHLRIARVLRSRGLPGLLANLGGVLGATVLVAAMTAAVLSLAMASLEAVFARVNDTTSEGLAQPTSTTVSGSAESVVRWADLGADGRDFIGGVPSRERIEAFAGPPSRDPVRVYVGVDSSDDPERRAELAVEDLVRLGGFERQVLVVATSTGTGQLDPKALEPVELMYGGDTAIASTQYSVLPSWLSFLVDQEKARRAGQTLFEAVRAHWESLPVDRRPVLVVFGESLGAFGAEAPFGDVAEMAARTDGALLVGPPAASPVHRGATEARDTGSPAWQPVFGAGRTLRFGSPAADLDHPATAWNAPRLAYLQNASDPVVWWSPRLVWSRPDWLVEPPGPGVWPHLRWLPVITFLRLTGDMMDSTSVPAGNGHVYGDQQAGAWARIIPPAGWTQAETTRLQDQFR